MNTQSNHGGWAAKRRSKGATAKTFESQGQRATSSEHEPHAPLTDMTTYFSTASYMPQRTQKGTAATTSLAGRKNSLRGSYNMPPRSQTGLGGKQRLQPKHRNNWVKSRQPSAHCNSKERPSNGQPGVPMSLDASRPLQPEQVGAGLLAATRLPIDDETIPKESFCDIKMEDDNSQSDDRIVSPLPTKYQKLGEMGSNRMILRESEPSNQVSSSHEPIHSKIGQGLTATAKIQQLSCKQETPCCPKKERRKLSFGLPEHSDDALFERRRPINLRRYEDSSQDENEQSSNKKCLKVSSKAGVSSLSCSKSSSKKPMLSPLLSGEKPGVEMRVSQFDAVEQPEPMTAAETVASRSLKTRLSKASTTIIGTATTASQHIRTATTNVNASQTSAGLRLRKRRDKENAGPGEAMVQRISDSFQNVTSFQSFSEAQDEDQPFKFENIHNKTPFGLRELDSNNPPELVKHETANAINRTETLEVGQGLTKLVSEVQVQPRILDGLFDLVDQDQSMISPTPHKATRKELMLAPTHRKRVRSSDMASALSGSPIAEDASKGRTPQKSSPPAIVDRFIPRRISEAAATFFTVASKVSHDHELLQKVARVERGLNDVDSLLREERDGIRSDAQRALDSEISRTQFLHNGVGFGADSMLGGNNNTEVLLTAREQLGTNEQEPGTVNAELASLSRPVGAGLTPVYRSIFDAPSSLHQASNQLALNVQSCRSSIGRGLMIDGHSVPPRALLPGVSASEDSVLSPIDAVNSTPKSHAQEDQEKSLLRKIANYDNLLEQNLIVEDSSDVIDGTAASKLLMTNLSESEQDQSCNPRSVQLQKSVLGGRLLNTTGTVRIPLISEGAQDLTLKSDFIDFNQSLAEMTRVLEEPAKPVRKIPSQPFRVLDAPGLQDDFYLNLVDWSAQNVLAVALESAVYVWNATTSTVANLCDLSRYNDQITSLSWSNKGAHLSVGTKSGQVHIWDINARKKVRTLNGHQDRVSSLAWSNVTPSLLASGSKDRSILVRDLRSHKQSYMKLAEHRQEVCGLRWSVHDENQLASGGNDNQLFIWQATSTQPLAKFSDHQAAVKAINWSPLHRGLLATGGGTADQCIRFWDTIKLKPLQVINSGSQVCNLVFSKTNDELVSTHGYSLNQVIVWKYPTMEKLATLTGHTFRVLYLAMNPDGSQIVTGAGDERLRFWNVFPKSKSSKVGPVGSQNIVGSGNSSLFPSNLDVR